MIDASLSRRTFSVQNTFGFATDQGISNVVVIHAITNSSSIQESANGVGSTRGWIAWIWWGYWTFVSNTSFEWVANEAWRTSTDGVMPLRSTLSIDSTTAWTRILALGVDTCQVERAIILSDTFRFATFWSQWITLHARQTRAKSLLNSRIDSAKCVASTW